MSDPQCRALVDAIDRLIDSPAPPGAQALAQALRVRHGDTVAAVLFYGSNFRRGDDSEGLLDLYVVVDDAHAALGKRLSAFACRRLPPNVYYLELPLAERTVRCKYALLETGAFSRYMTARQSYFWGRFGQASGLLYARRGRPVTDCRGAGASRADAARPQPAAAGRRLRRAHLVAHRARRLLRH